MPLVVQVSRDPAETTSTAEQPRKGRAGNRTIPAATSHAQRDVDAPTSSTAVTTRDDQPGAESSAAESELVGVTCRLSRAVTVAPANETSTGRVLWDTGAGLWAE